MKEVDIYTDGACIGNPGRGGYGAVLRYGTYERWLSQGYRRTTNNRMELLAAIESLEALKEPCNVRLYSDSQYLVNMVRGRYPWKWEAKGWMRSGSEKALNPDLWERLIRLCERHQVEFIWVKGHVGHAENEQCDRLAVMAANGDELLVDEGYEGSRRRR